MRGGVTKKVTANQHALQNALSGAFQLYIGIDRTAGTGMTSAEHLLLRPRVVDLHNEFVCPDFVIKIFLRKVFFSRRYFSRLGIECRNTQ